MKWAVVALLIGCGHGEAVVPVPDAPPPWKPPIHLAPAPPPPQLAYAPSVTSLRLRRSIEARLAPRADAKSLGTVGGETRVRWQDSTTATAGPGCSRWIEIEPRGWICDKYLEPTTKQPFGRELPHLKDGEIVPGIYGKVSAQGAKVFKNVAEAKAGKAARTIAGSVTVRKMDEVDVGGKPFWKTQTGDLIEASKIAVDKPSTFAGVRLDAEGAPELPIAWAQSRKNLIAKVTMYAGPSTSSRTLRSLSARTVVKVLGASKDGKMTQVSLVGVGGSIATADLHIARVSDPPEETRADERWLDVDLDEQVVVAFEGTKPAYATLVSSGQPKYPTPSGLYRIWMKLDETDMNGQMGDEQPYSVATVPWTMFFARDLAFHTAYWHDRFGEARSHGCVNLSPVDARALYFWATPDVPPGWSMAQGVVERPGSPVRIHSAALPAVEYRGYAKRVHEALSGSATQPANPDEDAPPTTVPASP